MEVLYSHCAGLDVHKDSVVACVRHMADGKVTTHVKTFKTTTAELMLLSDWLSAEAVTHIVMEVTGIYWKPVWHLLSDGEFELALANAGPPATGLRRCGGTRPTLRTCLVVRPTRTTPCGWPT